MSFFVDQEPMANAKIDLEQVQLTINSDGERHEKIIGLCQSCTLGFVARFGEFKRFV